MDKVKVPFDDKNMIYDMDSHMYVLTPFFCTNELGFPEGLGLKGYNEQKGSSAAIRFLKRVSSVVYRFVYAHSQNVAITEFIMAKDLTIREKIKDALAEQLLYMRKNGDLGLYSGVDYRKGSVLKVPKYKKISEYAIDILNECELLYTGELHCPCNFIYRGDY